MSKAKAGENLRRAAAMLFAAASKEDWKEAESDLRNIAAFLQRAGQELEKPD
jgi:hypothetical protein